MIGWYLLAFFIGAICGIILMGLMAASKEKVVHVYHEKDGSISILSDDPAIIVEHHKVE